MHHLLKTDNYGGTGEEYVGNAQAVKNITLGGVWHVRMHVQYADMNKAIRKRTQSTTLQSPSPMKQAEAFVATYETIGDAGV